MKYTGFDIWNDSMIGNMIWYHSMNDNWHGIWNMTYEIGSMIMMFDI